VKPIIPSVYQYQRQVYRQDFPWRHSRLGFVPLVVPQPRPWPHGPHAEGRPRGPLAVPWRPLFIRRSPRRHPRGGGRVPGFVAVPPQARTSYTFSAVVPNHSRASPYVTIHMHSPPFFLQVLDHSAPAVFNRAQRQPPGESGWQPRACLSASDADEDGGGPDPWTLLKRVPQPSGRHQGW